jgi:hypothetical protein
MTSKNKREKKFPSQYFIIFISLALTLTLTITYFKLMSLYYWLYSGDLYLCEQILTETLKGNFGLEFAFGKFGCHYYLFLILLLPLKIIFGNQMVILLIVLPVIIYFITTSILFLTLQSLTKNSLLSFICSLLFLLAPNIVRGLYSVKHGSNLIDDLSGFIAVLFVLFLLAYQKINNNSKKYFNILYTVFYILFLLLSEFFVFLGAIYFLLNSIYYKNKNYITFFVISFILLLIEIVFHDKFFIPISWNMFNRGLTNFMFIFNYNEHLKFLESVPISLLIEYAGTILAITGMLIVLIVKDGKINMLIVGLFIMGLMKCGLGYILQDLNVTSWHNFSGIIMMTGAISLQMAEQTDLKRIPYVFNFSLAGLFVIYFICGDIPFLKNTALEIFTKKEYVLERKDDLIKIIKLIDKKKLSIVPDETKVEFIFNDYSRFVIIKKAQLRLDYPPVMVDYIVLPREEVEQLHNKLGKIKIASGEKDMSGIVSNDFKLIAQNKHYLLFKRTNISDKDKIERKYYFDMVGLKDT